MSGVWYHFALGGRQHRVRLSDEHLFGQARQCSQTTLISEPQRVPSPPPEAPITLPPAPTEHGARQVQQQASQSQLKTQPQPTSSSAALEQPCDEPHFRTSNQGQSSVPSSGQESEVHEDAAEGKELDYDHNNLTHGQGTGRPHPQENAGSAGATVATENSSLAHWETFSFPSWIPQAKEGDIGWRLFEGLPCTVIDSDVHLRFGQWPFRFPAYGKKIANGPAKLFLRDVEWDPEVAVQPHACSPVASWILNRCHIVFASEAHLTQWQPYRPCRKTLNEVEDRFFHLIAEATGPIGGLENIWDIKQPIAHCNKDVAISASLKGLVVRLADGGARFALESTNNDSMKTLILPGTQSDRTFLGRVPSRTILPDKQRLNMASYGSPQHLLLKVQRNAQGEYDRLLAAYRPGEGTDSLKPVREDEWQPFQSQDGRRSLFFINLVRIVVGPPGTGMLPAKDTSKEKEAVVATSPAVVATASATANAGSKRKHSDDQGAESQEQRSSWW